MNPYNTTPPMPPNVYRMAVIATRIHHVRRGRDKLRRYHVEKVLPLVAPEFRDQLQEWLDGDPEF